MKKSKMKKSKMKKVIRKSVLFGIGSVILTKETLEKRINTLVKSGKLSKAEGKRFAKEFLSDAKIQRAKIEIDAKKEFDRTLKQLLAAQKKEIRTLKTQMKKLQRKLKAKTKKGARKIAKEVLKRTEKKK